MDVHDLPRGQTGWYCRRCPLLATPARRAAAAKAKRPVPKCVEGDPEHAEWIHAWGRHQMLQRESWRSAITGKARPKVKRLQIEAMRTGADHGGAATGMRWRSHLVVKRAVGADACLRCGETATVRDARRLLATPCSREVGCLPPRVRAPLLGGAFDAYVFSAPPQIRDRALAHGWVPPVSGDGSGACCADARRSPEEAAACLAREGLGPAVKRVRWGAGACCQQTRAPPWPD